MRSGLSRSVVVAGMLFLVVGMSVPAQAGGYGHHYRGGHYYRHHHSHNGAYLAGGLILGSLITHAYMSQPRPEPYYGDRTVVVQAPAVVQSAPIAGRHLLRDRYGNCYEKNYNDRGDEILVELDPVECEW